MRAFCLACAFYDTCAFACLSAYRVSYALPSKLKSLRVARLFMALQTKQGQVYGFITHTLPEIQNRRRRCSLLWGSCSRARGSISVIRVPAHPKTPQAARSPNALDACCNNRIQWICNRCKVNQEIRSSKQDARKSATHRRAKRLADIASGSLPKQKAHKHKRRIRCHILSKVKLKTSHTKRLQSQANSGAADKGTILLHKKATSAL